MRASLLLVLAAASCAADPSPGTPYPWDLPAAIAPPRVPEDNPMTVEKVELGRHLFYDSRISVNQTYSCATCHVQARAFSDGRARALGATGQLGRRNSQTLANAGYLSAYTWASSLERTLEHQMLLPLFLEHPVELGLADQEDEMLARLRADPSYQEMFRAAFPGDDDPFTLARFIAATASFVRSLVSVHAPYTEAVRLTDLPDAARRGADMFFSERLECYHCHGGFNFSDSTVTSTSSAEELAFHNTGLYNLDGLGAYPPEDRGLYDLTARPEDMGKFRAPSLLNVAVSAPYFHDGSAASLKAVIGHYGAAGRNTASGPNAGDGRASPLKDGLVLGFSLNEDEQADLLALFDSLTDERFLTDPRHANPFVDCPPVLRPSCPEPAPGYAADVAPIVAARCAGCHSPAGLAAAMPLTSQAELAAERESITAQLQGCTMPPSTSPALAPEERNALLAWLACGARDD